MKNRARKQAELLLASRIFRLLTRAVLSGSPEKYFPDIIQYDNIKLHVVKFNGDSMINLSNIHSLSDFQRHTKDFLGKLKETQCPIVLTIKGKAEFVLQDAQSYQQLLDKLEAAEDVEAIREGYDQAQAGKLTSFEEFDSEFRAKNGV